MSAVRVGVIALVVAFLLGLGGLWAWALGIEWSERVWTAYTYTVPAIAAVGVMLVLGDAS